MAFNTEEFLAIIDRQIESKHLLKHTLYVVWSKGELSRECLKEYALEYYHHVKAFPTYLSALHSQIQEEDTRIEVLKNLIDEEMGSPNHPKMWKSFALALGATEEEIAQHKPNAEIRNLIETFRQACLQGTVGEGLSALYSYESQIPSVSKSKIDGLRKFYGMTQPEQWKYFTVHMLADVEHSQIERALLRRYVDESNASQAQDASNKVLDALNGFLTGLCMRHNIACAA